jgi:hypothetical protein
MTLCAICRTLDFRKLLITCLQQCRDRQASNEAHYAMPQCDSPKLLHHGDIFAIKTSSRYCDLCNVIFRAFEDRKVINAEKARNVPIVSRVFNNKVEICYDDKPALIKLCGLDLYMDEVHGEQIDAEIDSKKNNRLQLIRFSRFAISKRIVCHQF